jgi:hypothetical protein
MTNRVVTHHEPSPVKLMQSHLRRGKAPNQAQESRCRGVMSMRDQVYIRRLSHQLQPETNHYYRIKQYKDY